MLFVLKSSFFFMALLFVPLLFFSFLVILWRFYWIKKGIKPFPKGVSNPKLKHDNFFYKLFFLFPRQLAKDILRRDPDHFREFGFNILEGEQGAGKTITLVYMLMRYKRMYPRIKIKTNLAYAFEDAPIKHWKDVVASTNGIYGEVDVLDEVQNWFNSMQSKNFPPEMLTEVTQQRKQTKKIIGTTQVFGRIAKPLREQTYRVYRPFTLFNCFTFVFIYKPKLTSDAEVEKMLFKGMFSFVHSDELREAYDTYKKIEDLKKSGFVPRSEQLHNVYSADIGER